MISEAEIRRRAAMAGVDTMVQDLDYGLGWFLAGFFATPTAVPPLIFKGGTCLRKCYFIDYRFSEDLDFTMTRSWSLDALNAAIEQTKIWSIDAGGPDFGAAPTRVEVMNDEYGLESYQARIYYRGPLRWGGTPRAIQLDVSRGEALVFPTATRTLLHNYSDVSPIHSITIPCYELAEMFSEKLRAISGQRRFAISRDIYDIYQLSEAGVSLEQVRQALPVKFAAKGLSLTTISVETLDARREIFETDWQRRLVHLLPPQQPISFAKAWQRVRDVVEFLQS